MLTGCDYMKSIKTNLMIILLSVISFISTICLAGYDFSAKSIYFNLFERFLLLFDTLYLEEFLHIAASFAMVISILFLNKTKIPLIFSMCAIGIAELMRVITLLNHYLNYRGGFDYAFLGAVLNALFALMFIILVLFSFKHRINKINPIIISFAGSLICLAVTLVSAVYLRSFFNLSLVSYYISTYILFCLIVLKFADSN